METYYKNNVFYEFVTADINGATEVTIAKNLI